MRRNVLVKALAVYLSISFLIIVWILKMIKKVIYKSLGIIDAHYRDEVCNIMVNLSNGNIVINDSERICQMVIAKHRKAEWKCVESLIDSERGVEGLDIHGKL